MCIALYARIMRRVCVIESFDNHESLWRKMIDERVGIQHSRITIYMVYRHEDHRPTNSQTFENLSSSWCYICTTTSKMTLHRFERLSRAYPLLTYIIYILYVICIYLHIIYTL